MKRKSIRAFALALALALLAGCGGQAASLPESGTSPAQGEAESAALEPQETPEPYTGPLYEVTVVPAKDMLPDFEGIAIPLGAGTNFKVVFCAYANSGDFLAYEKEPYGGDYYLTNSKLMSFPELDEYVFLGTLSGRTIFCNEEGKELFITDGDGNVLYTAPENIEYLYAYEDYLASRRGAEGLLPVYNSETGCDGYLDLENFSIWELNPEYAVSGYTRNGTPVRGSTVNLYPFCEGMRAVMYAETTDTFFHIAKQNGEDLDGHWAEADIARFVDRNGEFVFKFSDLPQFDGQIICSATNYYQGRSIITCHARGIAPGVSVPTRDVFQGTYYEIDTQGNILREYTEDERWERIDQINEEKKLAGDVRVWRILDGEAIETDEIRLTDDLVLYSESRPSRFTTFQVVMEDCNGTIYKLKVPNGEQFVQAQVFANGLVLLLTKKDFGTYNYYYVRYEDIRPEGYTADTSDFYPNAMSIHDYDLPE